MTDEKMTDKVQAAVPADTVMQPEEKSKIVYEGGGNLAGVQRKKGKGLILDDGRIEAMKEYLSPEELYLRTLFPVCADTIRRMIYP